MTTEVKVIHNGGNHKVRVQTVVNAGTETESVSKEVVLEEKGAETSIYVFTGQSINVIEAGD